MDFGKTLDGVMQQIKGRLAPAPQAAMIPAEPVQAQPGQVRDYVNPKMIDAYSRQYPWLSKLVGTPDMLMQFIDSQHQENSRRSPGSGSDLFRAQKAKMALQDIYGINDYNPKGMMKWDEETKNWVNPNMVGGGEGPRF